MIRHIPISRQLGVVLIAACLHAGSAWAQNAPARPFRGLFGGNQRNPGARQALDLTANVQAGHDDDILAAGTSSQNFDPRYQLGGEYAATNLALAYSTASAGRAFTFSGRAASDFKYSPPALPQMGSPRHEGAVSMAVTKTKGLFSFRAHQGASYVPYRVVSLFPSLPLQGIETVTGPGQDFAISSHQNYGYRSDADLGVRLGRRSSLNFDYSRAATHHSQQARDIVDQRLGGRLSYRMTPHASLRLGYGYRLSSYSGSPDDEPVVSRSLDAGIDYNRALSFSRKTSISFNSGSAATSHGDRTVYHAIGGATLNHEIGRSWSAKAIFSRGLSFVEGYSTPFLSNGFSVDTGGYLGRRVDLGVTAGYADGTRRLSANGSRYATYTGAARMRVALSRYGFSYLQYFYYQYRFRDSARVIQGFPPSMERRGVRAGLTLWLPLLR